ncbi:MAG: type II toxin-antitoxin system PemK/MazF family toxin [Candidatus Hydrogenedentes bacterium]|nr:type II toxin-antitoxin system PemK/MazF family toxin [Candidatus Hydrogenedentota bacterium]
MPGYIPKSGDYVTLSFDPQAGHEQQGRRPALVISNDTFNRHTGFSIVCPITRTKRDYPFHLALEGETGIEGYVMIEQVKSIDYRARDARRIGKASSSLLSEVLARLDACIY